MSRLGDLLQTERLRREMTLKQVSKLSGVSAAYLKAVEEGKKIIPDDQARRILKKIGLTEHTEQGFTLNDIAATVDLQTAAPTIKTPSQTRVDATPAYTDDSAKDSTVQGSVWLDALQSVLKRVPVLNAVMEEVDHRMLPVLQGRIEGASPDKVFYFKVPDDSIRGFRIMKGDLCFMVPAASPIDGAIMLVDVNGQRALRKIKKLNSMTILLQSYDREYAAQTLALPDVSFLGHVVRVEFTLPE